MRRTAIGNRAIRILAASLLMSVLFFTTAFAAVETGELVPVGTNEIGISGSEETADPQNPELTDPAADPQNPEPAVPAADPADGDKTDTDEAAAAEPAKKLVKKAGIIKKGRYYYYKDANGNIRKKAGFVKVAGKYYYVRKGGRIKTGCTFRVNKKYYRASKYGFLKTGVYNWFGHLYYSTARGRWKRTAGFVEWNGDQYYVQKGGRIITDEGFVIDNVAYVADSKGRVTEPVFPKRYENKVIRTARRQVGIMTGKTYWVWYYRTVFRDTDRTPWCGAFVAWCFNRAGFYDRVSVAKRFGPLGYVPSYSRYANQYRKWINRRRAHAGDIIVFGRNRHVGIVEGVYKGYIITIEGNAGPTAAFGCGKPGAVVRKIYDLNNSDIMGVIRVLD